MKVTLQFTGGLEIVTATPEIVVDVEEMKLSQLIEWIDKNLVKSHAQPFITGNTVFALFYLL